MLGQGGPVKVYVATRPVDFRKGIDGLALAVQEMFGLDPFCGAIFVFRAKRADRIKMLVGDQTGMVLVHKRLEGGKFVWPQVRDGVMRMSSAQLAALFEGLDWRLARPERVAARWLQGKCGRRSGGPAFTGQNGISVIHFRHGCQHSQPRERSFEGPPRGGAGGQPPAGGYPARLAARALWQEFREVVTRPVQFAARGRRTGPGRA